MLVIGSDLPDSPSRWAFLVSLMAHAVLVATAGMFVARQSLAVEEEPPWPGGEVVGEGVSAGDTFDIDGLVDEDPSERRDVRQSPEASAATDDSDEEATPAPAAVEPDRVSTPAAVAPALAPSALRPPRPAKAQAALGPRQASGRSTGDAGADESTAAVDHGSGHGYRRRYGAEGTSRGVRNLARAFTRAIPAAVSADRAWGRLALGEAGTVDVVVEIDAAGKIVEVEVPEEAPLPLQALVHRTLALLRAGRFALRGLSPGAGREILRIAVVLSQGEPIESEGAAPSDALRLGHEPPTQKRPGRAYFDLVSGRHFEATVTILTPAEGGDAADEPSEDTRRDGGSDGAGGSPPASASGGGPA